MNADERDYDEEQYNAELCPACGISPCPFGGRCDEVPVVPLLSGVAVGPVERDEGPVDCGGDPVSRLDEIAAHGNTPPPIRFEDWPDKDWSHLIECADGFRLSVIAGLGCHCRPRPGSFDDADVPPDYPGPYTHLEVGLPSERPEPWDVWEAYAAEPDMPTETIYDNVPVPLVRLLIQQHGGQS